MRGTKMEKQAKKVEKAKEQEKTSKSEKIVTADDGHIVKVAYKGTFDDGHVFDSSEGRELLEFIIGSGQVIPGFNDAIKGMKVGDAKDISLEPKDAYGEKDERLIQEVPKEAFGDHKIKVGDQIGVRGPTGQVMPVTITAITNDKVTVDLNHPMAGKRLNFNLKLVESKKLTEEEIEAMNSHSCCGGHDHDHGDHEHHHHEDHCGDKKNKDHKGKGQGCGGGCC